MVVIIIAKLVCLSLLATTVLVQYWGGDKARSLLQKGVHLDLALWGP
jgi:hypothetical protein